MLDPETLDRLRKQLEELKSELTADLAETDSAAPVALDTSIGRLSRMDAIQSQQMALELKRRQQNRLMRVERALSAMEKAAYGKCGRCSGPIAIERLEVQPDAVLCIKCAGQAK